MLKRNEESPFVLFYPDAKHRENTPLHNALAKNDTKSLKEMSRSDIISQLNQRSLGNTPLLLALKKGNSEAANYLLSFNQVDVNTPDNRGLTPLHWACMLRFDDVITTLCEKNANIDAVPKDFDMTNSVSKYTPRYLYENDVNFEAFRAHYNTFVEQWNTMTKGSNQGIYYRHYFDEAGYLVIKEEPCYTDIVFHIADICVNQGWAQKSLYDDARKSSMSTRAYATAFRTSIKIFVEQRNNRLVNPSIISILQHPIALGASNHMSSNLGNNSFTPDPMVDQDEPEDNQSAVNTWTR